MKYIKITLIVLLFPLSINAQEFKKNNYESTTEFVKRNIPTIENRVLELNEPVLETKYWDNKTPLLICFFLSYNDDIKFPDKYLVGYVFVETRPNIFKRILIDNNLDVSDNKINIERIFFINCDKDENKELAILFSQETGEGDLIDYEGKLFFTRFYDNFKISNPPDKLIEISKFKDLFYELDGKKDDGEFKSAKYKTESEVLKTLEQLGY
ncbi:MAG: hypothetical protein FGM14_02710 [Flavobacteriales bacterium]|nr:hypothetical protein [Flavobacteriales bacterium]